MKMKRHLKLLSILIMYELAAGSLQSVLSDRFPETKSRLAVCGVMAAMNAVLLYRILPRRFCQKSAQYTLLGFYLVNSVLSALPFFLRVFYISEYPAWLNHFIYVPIRLTAPLSEAAMAVFDREKNVNVMIAVFFIVGSVNLVVNLYNYIIFKKGCENSLFLRPSTLRGLVPSSVPCLRKQDVL